MDIIKHYIVDLVRRQSDGQLLAVYQCLGSDVTGYYLVDEQEREIRISEFKDGTGYRPEEDFFLKKAEVAKVRRNRETRALIAELNAKIVRSNVDALGALLERIDDVACSNLPLCRAGFRLEVDYEALQSMSREVQVIAEIQRLGDEARKMLRNAEEVDAKVLKRFALRQPFGGEAQEGK